MSQRRDEVDPVTVLMEVRDPIERARAHMMLGRRAAGRGDGSKAVRHFREAAGLDPGSAAPRAALHKMGETVEKFEATRSPRLKRLFSSVLAAGRR